MRSCHRPGLLTSLQTTRPTCRGSRSRLGGLCVAAAPCNTCATPAGSSYGSSYGRGTARKSSPQAPPALHVHRRYAPRPPRRPPPSASRPQVPAPASTSSSSRGEKAKSSSVGTFVYAAPGPRTLTFFLTQQPQQSRNTGLRQPMRTISCATLTRVEQDNPERPECPKIALVLCFWLFRGSIQLFGFVRTRRCHTHRSRWQPPASTVRSQ